jgi:hypothetical protein
MANHFFLLSFLNMELSCFKFTKCMENDTKLKKIVNRKLSTEA